MSIVLPAITALGTTWYVELFADLTIEKTNETQCLVGLFLSQFENTYSRFKTDSILSRLNQTGRLKDPDHTTRELLILGQQFYRDTSGIFNILLGEHLIARGYDATYSFRPTTAPGDFPSPLTDLIVTDTLITLTRGQLDLGGYGKGFLIDRLSAYLTTLGLPCHLINGGGDMYGTSDQGEAIEIYLEHPIEPGTYVGTTTLKDQGFAASSSHKRRWKVDDKEYSHIIHTAKDTTETLDDFGTYIKAPKAVMADVWATTLLISDPDNHTETLKLESIDFSRFYTKQQKLLKSPGF
jgi:FAD:protein FMN transferase